MIEDSIKNLKEQLLWAPQVQNAENLKTHGKLILCGMGGSRIASGFLKTLRSEMNIQIWNDYGLPPGYQRDSMVIVSSYSGNTEEAIGNFHAAVESGLKTAVISSGGKLLLLAKENGIPYVEMPTGHHPRMAAGYHFKALLALLGENEMRDEVNTFSEQFSFEGLDMPGKSIAEQIVGIPMIYASHPNRYLAEYFKISFNETAKSPAFSNVMPELAHNELSGLHEPMSFIFIHDATDHPRVQIKMAALEALLKERGFAILDINLTGSSIKKIFNAYAIASWTALFFARKNNIDAEEQEVIEEFKKRI